MRKIEMNDFTKEELQIIYLDMTIYAEKTKLLKESPSHKALRDKIESMIDNYPKCGMQRVADGMCWDIECDYKEIQFDDEIKSFNAQESCQHKRKSFPGVLGLSKCLECGKGCFEEQCQHESDGLLHKDLSIPKLLGYKCKKCGEFY